jgi:hypothetical protein
LSGDDDGGGNSGEDDEGDEEPGGRWDPVEPAPEMEEATAGLEAEREVEIAEMRAEAVAVAAAAAAAKLAEEAAAKQAILDEAALEVANDPVFSGLAVLLALLSISDL